MARLMLVKAVRDQDLINFEQLTMIGEVMIEEDKIFSLMLFISTQLIKACTAHKPSGLNNCALFESLSVQLFWGQPITPVGVACGGLIMYCDIKKLVD